MNYQSVFSELLPALIGGVVGLFISVIFDDALRNLKRNIVRRYKRLFAPNVPHDPHVFTVGSNQTTFVVVDGDGKSGYQPDQIESSISTRSFPLPQELNEIRNEIQMEEQRKEEEGLPYKWNGPLYGLARHQLSRTTDREDMSLKLEFFHTDYFTFQATNMNLNFILPEGQTIRQKYIPDDPNKTEPLLANGFGIALVIITSDENIILTVRNENAGTRGSQMDVSVVEGIHPALDRNAQHPGPDLFSTAVRGANEEIGIIIDRTTIEFLGYGVDLEFYQWNMIGYAHVPHSAAEIQEIRSRGASGRWENTSLLFKNFTAGELARIILNEPMWSTATVALYWTGVRHFGKSHFDKTISKLSR